MQETSVQCGRSDSGNSDTSQHSGSKGKLTKRRKEKPVHISTGTRNCDSTQSQKRFPNGSTESITSSVSSTRELRSASHIACQLSKDYPGYFEYLQPCSVFRKPVRKSLSLPNGFKDSYKLQHPDLSEGDREYLCHKAAVYSMSDMKEGAEWRFRQALQHQIKTGFHTYAECKKYFDYLEKPRKRQFGTDPRVWRNPPKIPPKPLFFHRRSSTVPAGFERSQSARDFRTAPDHRLPRRTSSASSIPACWKETAFYYDPGTRRTLSRRK